jgi:LysR family glycine cleavage system transcriptional activator
LRHGSFTEAADELLVSQAAVSKRIAQLEGWLGVPLFQRRKPRLVATSAARRLGDRISVALEFIDQSIAEVANPANPIVRIASMTAVGMFWLQPRLKDFALSEDACMFNLTLSDDLTNLFSEDNDLAIVYGDGSFPGWNATKILTEELVPLATPKVAQRLARSATLVDEQAPLLGYDRLSPEWIDWEVWSERLQVVLPDNLPRTHCSSYSQSIGRALAGQGICLGSLPLFETEIAEGRLARLEHPSYSGSGGYWLAWPEARHMTDETKRFLKVFSDLKVSDINMDDLPIG